MTKQNLSYNPTRNQDKRKDYIGNRYGRLVVIEEIEPYRPPNCYPVRKFRCQCDCGDTIDTVMSPLVIGRTKSCGCFNHENLINRNTTHGKRNHPLSKIWSAMKSRCYYENNNSYHNYGMRGIIVCDEWKHSFESFYKWAIDNRWGKDKRLDRIDNDGDYSPGNCRFVGHGLSARNQRLLAANNVSGFRGVNQHGSKWCSRIRLNGKRFYLGSFKTPEESAHAYDAKAKELNAGHPLNFPNEDKI